ncbi:MAG: diguanylate cyclase [Synergistales bacterium]|nr:diguanylate cyclase [Synergistales bacterium]
MQVLIAEDEAISRLMLERLLRKEGYEIASAVDGEEAWEVMSSPSAPPIAILDWVMPGIDGLEVCRRVRASERADQVHPYIIIVTGQGTREDVVTGIGAGADDYILKPYEPGELKIRLQVGTRTVKLQRELLDSREKLKYLAARDALTGLLNRRAIMERLNEERDRAIRQQSPLGLAWIDLDNFKAVNDRYGHQRGDDFLCEISQLFRQSIRSYDILGRFGGDEFLAIFPTATEKETRKICSRLRDNVSKHAFLADCISLSMSVSVGYISTVCTEDVDADTLLGSADRYLYRAKRGGRNRIEGSSELIDPEENGADSS